jgi:hypothetical protein
MSTTWSIIASEVCRDALEHLSAYGAGETVSAADQVKALRALDGMLKELPLVGYVWPKLSGEVALVWSAGTPQTVSLPADYFNYPAVWKTVNGQKVPLAQIPHADWVKMLNRTQTAAQPTHFYISPDKTLYFWPVPTADPGASLQYQRIINDSAATAVPDVMQFWLNPLGWMVADEMSLDFGLSAPDRLEIHQRAEAKKKLALESSIPSEVISFSVAD